MARIVINSLLEGGRAGGVQAGIRVLAEALTSVAHESHEFVFLTLDGLDDWLAQACDAPGLSTVPIERGTTRSTANLLRASTAGRTLERAAIWTRDAVAGPERGSGRFEELGADVAHFPYQRAELTSVPFVYQPWDLQHRHLPKLFDRGTVRYRNRTYGSYCRAAAVVVVPTSFVRDDVVEAYDVPPERVRVIAPHVSSERDHATEPRTEQADDPYVIYPARTWNHKNHQRLIQALGRCRRDGTDIRLVCTGAPLGNENELLELAVGCGVGDLITFTGFVSDQEMTQLFEGARFMVFPSLFEGWGYPVVEAFEAGIPVACAAGAWLDAVADNTARFDPYDIDDMATTLLRLWHDEAERMELVRQGTVRLADFRPEVMGNAYLEAYSFAGDNPISL